MYFLDPDLFLLGMERPKKAIFGCFRPIMGLFFIEYEDFGTEIFNRLYRSGKNNDEVLVKKCKVTLFSKPTN